MLVVDSRVLWSGGSQLQCNCKWLQIIINIFYAVGSFFSFFVGVPSILFSWHLTCSFLWPYVSAFFIASIFLKNSFWLLFFNGFFNMLYIHRRTRDPAGNNGSMTMSLFSSDRSSLRSSLLQYINIYIWPWRITRSNTSALQCSCRKQDHMIYYGTM